ncbi:APH(3')-II family aminoglycoside O-phosphotransferase [Stenotrophomonas maltophilia]|uniref:APH(3')-II family aminoglycoside O-phosphotransferase n=1 Tax=Stenotrophomonas maltophilia TaxID=40324 RepID=UPI0016608FB6|nr:APH(3')-II family aminoglycoside O-phosphotransferase [Stenotrophomonas maltophilia]
MDEHNATPDGMPLPLAWQKALADARIERQSMGVSRADVARVLRPGRPDAFLKSELIDAFSELGDEIARLRWLQAQGQPAPTVIATAEEAGRHWLLMSALPGRDLASSPELAPQQRVEILADALRGLHALPVAACPFDQRLASRLPAAQARVEAGRVDADDFDDERLGQSPQQVFAQLCSTRPDHEDLVVSHGDACVPNLMVSEGRFSGFIDCGRLGVADRYQDLALAARSLVHNFGDTRWVTPLFQRYGAVADERRLAFYRLLDEFF